jgi:hypothetical protein
MSIVSAEPATTDVRSDIAPDFPWTAEPATTELAARPRPAFGHPHEIRLSAELVEVIAAWIQNPRWKRWIAPAPLPGYRRYLD